MFWDPPDYFLGQRTFNTGTSSNAQSRQSIGAQPVQGTHPTTQSLQSKVLAATMPPATRSKKRKLASAEEAAQMPSFIGAQVTILVGNTRVHHYQSELTKSSEFLRNEFDLGHRGEGAAPIDLSSENFDVFHGYRPWLYSGKVVAKAGKNDAIGNGHLACLYVLGEKLIDVKFRKDVLQALFDNLGVAEVYPLTVTIKIIYDGTAKGSPARRLMVDFWACSGSLKWEAHQQLSKAVSVEFGNDFIPALLHHRERSSYKPWVTKPATYLANTDTESNTIAHEPASDSEEETEVVRQAHIIQDPNAQNQLQILGMIEKSQAVLMARMLDQTVQGRLQ